MILAWAVTATYAALLLLLCLWFSVWLGRETRDDLRKARAKLARRRRQVADLRVRLETYRDDETYELLDRALGNDTGEC